MTRPPISPGIKHNASAQYLPNTTGLPRSWFGPYCGCTMAFSSPISLKVLHKSSMTCTFNRGWSITPHTIASKRSFCVCSHCNKASTPNRIDVPCPHCGCSLGTGIPCTLCTISFTPIHGSITTARGCILLYFERALSSKVCP